MIFCPAVSNNFIAVALERTHIDTLDSDQSNEVTYKILLLNSVDSDKDFGHFVTRDFESKHSEMFYHASFYQKDKLEEDGFIFPDGSLRFEFFVRKNNYRKRLEIAQERIKVDRAEKRA